MFGLVGLGGTYMSFFARVSGADSESEVRTAVSVVS